MLLLMIRSPLQPPELIFIEAMNGSSTGPPHYTLDSHKVSMLAPFTNIPREESTLAHYRSKIQNVTEAEDGFFSSSLLSSLHYFHLKQEK